MIIEIKKTMLCNSCGSYRHLLAECPDSWENMENKYVSQNDLKSLFPCVNMQQQWISQI